MEPNRLNPPRLETLKQWIFWISICAWCCFVALDMEQSGKILEIHHRHMQLHTSSLSAAAAELDAGLFLF